MSVYSAVLFINFSHECFESQDLHMHKIAAKLLVNCSLIPSISSRKNGVVAMCLFFTEESYVTKWDYATGLGCLDKF